MKAATLKEALMRHLTIGEPSECWIWTGAARSTNRKAPDHKYGDLHFTLEKNRAISLYPHRVAYEIFKGPIPQGMTIDHLCFNPLCCNPSHLAAKTQAANSANHSPEWHEKQRLRCEALTHSRGAA